MQNEPHKRSPEEGGDPNPAGEIPDGGGTSDPSNSKRPADENVLAARKAAGARDKALVKRTIQAPAVPATGGGGQSIIPKTTPLTSVPPVGQRPSNHRRLRSVFSSAAIFVGIPTLLVILYFGVIASDQFASRADFIIKTRGNTHAVPGGGMMGGMAPVNPLTIVDMLIVQEYVESAQVLQDIAPLIDVHKLFSSPEADTFARLKEEFRFRRILNGTVWSEGLFAPVTEEDLLKYWKKMVVVNFDMTTGISSLEARAFTAEDAKDLADAVLSLGEKLVNRLSVRSQSDTLAFARKEVGDAHQRAIETLDELEKFQTTARQLDPEGYAKIRGQIQGDLEGDLSQYLAQLETLRRELPETAPGIQQIKNRIAGLQEQLLIQKLESTKSSTRGSANEMLNEFSKRRLESDFATKAYMSALTSLENARSDATQQSRYLEAFVRPQMPQKADYPKRLQSVLVVFLGAAAIWGIGGLLIAAAKEHL